MVLTLLLGVVEVPCDGDNFLHAERFASLQLHGRNYDLVPTHAAMRAEVGSFLRRKRATLDVNGMSLVYVRLALQDLRPIPLNGVALEPPRKHFYDSWVSGLMR